MEKINLTEPMIIDGHIIRLSFAENDNESAVDEVREILLTSFENPHNLQLFSEGGVADAQAV